MGPEKFRDISEYPDYEISEYGMVRNRRTHVILMWRPSTVSGKACVELIDPENRSRRMMVSVRHIQKSAWPEASDSAVRYVENWRSAHESGQDEPESTERA